MRPTRALAALPALLARAFAPGSVLALGPGGPVWVSPDRQPPGIPARVVLNQDMSGPAPPANLVLPRIESFSRSPFAGF
jgi:hypothetical protein